MLMTAFAFAAMADNMSTVQMVKPERAYHYKNFEEMKLKLIQRLQNKVSKAQERLDCVQKAQDSKELRMCLHRHKKHTLKE